MNKLKEFLLFILIGVLLTGWLWVIFHVSLSLFLDVIISGMHVNIQILIILLYTIAFLFIGIFILKRIFRKDDTSSLYFPLKCTFSTMFIHICVFIFTYYLYTNRSWGVGIIGVYVGLSIFLAIVFEIVWIIIKKIGSKKKDA